MVECNPVFRQSFSPQAIALTSPGKRNSLFAGEPKLEPDMDDLPDRTPNDLLLTRAKQASGLSADERGQLTEAMRRLQASRGLVMRGADLIARLFGGAAAAGLRGLRVSPVLTGKMEALAEIALRRAFHIAVLGSGRKVRGAGRHRARLLAAAAGAAGGFSGLAGFLPDIAFTTLLIMRNIASIARTHGEDLSTEEARQACLEVFALGGGSEFGLDEQAEASYWSVRLLLQGRPVVMLFSEVASRYGLRISEKFALQAVPLVGAAGGALINSMFFEHYLSLAQVHFTLRRLERHYDLELVHREATAIAQRLRRSSLAPASRQVAARAELSFLDAVHIVGSNRHEHGALS